MPSLATLGVNSAHIRQRVRVSVSEPALCASLIMSLKEVHLSILDLLHEYSLIIHLILLLLTVIVLD